MSTSTKWTRILPLLLLCGAAAGSLLLAGVSRADPPAQEPGKPELSTRSYAAADGSSAIVSTEIQLGPEYFQQRGEAEGLTPGTEGLALAEDSLQGIYTTPPISSPLAISTDLVPLWRADLPAGTEIALETRLSQDGETWTEWALNPEMGAGREGNLHSGSLVWIGSQGPVVAQLRLSLRTTQSGSSPSVEQLQIVFSDASQGPDDATIATLLAEAGQEEVNLEGVCPPPMPPLVTRSQWGAPDGQESPRWPPQTTDVTHIVVQHTATPARFDQWNRLSPAFTMRDWSSVVRSLWNYHANTLRWGDIGYNYLVAPDGTIYEGRAGSQDGLHDIIGGLGDQDKNATEIAFIGCYGNCQSLGLTDAEPAPVMLDSGVALMAWKADQRQLDPEGQVYLNARLIPVIAGGRDMSATSSPGDNLYAWLPWMRQEVRDNMQCWQPPPVSAPIPAGTVSGYVVLQGRSDHQGATASNSQGDEAETDADGYFSLPTDAKLKLEAAGYLSLQADLRQFLAESAADDQGQVHLDLGDLNLPAGDVNNDELINVFDLTYMASHYQKADTAADLNQDGIVDILDLVLIANNYGLQGPLTSLEE